MLGLDNIFGAKKKSDRTADLFNAIDNIRAYSSFGARVVDWAQDHGVNFYDDPELNSLGSCRRDQRIRTNIHEIEKADVSLEYVLAHEIMHAIQAGISQIEVRQGKTYGLLGAIVHGLAREAGAESLAMMVYHQMERNGFDHAGKFFGDDADIKKGRHLFRKRFKGAYDRAIEQEKTEEEATLEGANAVFQSYMQECYAAIWSYADTYMIRYIEDIADKKITKDDQQRQLEALDVLQASHIGDDIFLAKEATIPMTFEELFGARKRLCQAAKYIEAYRQALGTTEDSVQRAFIRKQLKDDGNPFFGVDLNEVLKVWESQQENDVRTIDRKNVTDIMLELAGFDEPTQLHFNFFDDVNEATLDSKNTKKTPSAQAKSL